MRSPTSTHRRQSRTCAILARFRVHKGWSSDPFVRQNLGPTRKWPIPLGLPPSFCSRSRAVLVEGAGGPNADALPASAPTKRQDGNPVEAGLLKGPKIPCTFVVGEGG